MTNLTSHAKTELKMAGLFDDDSDYNGGLGDSVLELIQVFAKQGHSGYSAGRTLQLFVRLANYKELAPLTNDPDEWNEVSKYFDGKPMYQSRRNPTAFSDDNGLTYYFVSEKENGKFTMRTSADAKNT